LFLEWMPRIVEGQIHPEKSTHCSCPWHGVCAVRKGISRQWGTKQAFSYACCRDHFSALWKGLEKLSWDINLCIHVHI
jgi:hypothetical protein